MVQHNKRFASIWVQRNGLRPELLRMQMMEEELKKLQSSLAN